MALFWAGFAVALALSLGVRLVAALGNGGSPGLPSYKRLAKKHNELVARFNRREAQWLQWHAYAMGVVRPAGIVLPNPPVEAG